MKIAVIGAGIIGVTTAYELARDGHEVTVFERRLAAAEEGSFANAGIVAPGYVAPWAVPGMSWKIARHLFSRHAPVRIGTALTPGDLAWMWQSWRACQPETYLANRARMQRLALYSRECLRELRAELQFEYDRGTGYLVLLRTDKERALMQPGLQLLRDAGLAFRELGAEEARQIEPALHPHTSLAQAIHLPDDEVGNCRQFALLLKNQSQHMGVNYAFDTAIEAIDTSAGMALRLAGEASPRRFDAAVLCAGVDSARLLRPLGIKLPLKAVHGYSISAPIREPLDAPHGAVMDERYKVAISRLGNWIRVSGSAEIGYPAQKMRPGALNTLYKVLSDWFPSAAVMSRGVQPWKGARPMLPDGPPVLGASGIPGLWLNLGHGGSGWALSCGSARAVADLVSGKLPQIDLEGLDLGRLLP